MKIKAIDFGAFSNGLAPKRAHYNDAGIDCYAQDGFVLGRFGSNSLNPDTGEVRQAYIAKIPLGFGLEVPDGYMATIRPRSSMNAKGVITQIGTIDSGYRGEISAIFINASDEDLWFAMGDKICQIVVEPIALPDLSLELGSDRGDGGFGSTGR